ncbi:MAG TPA: branched-chain amino acid ABC transporter permease [Egibacteraceae bacterium]|nr:branched-chain amino acid ABC transporter permease [Actinomycetota bacterium]HWB72867.1 branched-chain amino acid ABC transporter permease [Egibacteraceae bacterium]
MDFSAIFADGARAAVGVEATVYALAAIGLNVHFGYTGLLNFGHVGFMLVGAYGPAIVVAQYGGPLWLGVLIGLACAVVLALVLGLPTLRLRADYLAITTIAAAEILRLIYRSNYARPVTNGVFGLQQFADAFYALSPIPPGSYGLGRLSFSARGLWIVLVGWALVALSALLVFALMRSPWGRVQRSIREDEDAARSLGKNVFGYKLQSLVLGGVVGAVGGIVLAFANQAVTPDSYNPVVTFFAYTVLILGGAGRVLGPVVGSVIFWFLVAGTDSFLRQAIGTGLVPPGLLAAPEVGAVRFALVGLGLMLLMAFRPEGLFGDRREMLLDAR